MVNKPIKIWARPSKDGRSFKYCLIYTDLDGKRRRKSLGYFNKRMAEQQASKLAEQLSTGYVEQRSMRLSKFVRDSLKRTGGQLRESSRNGYEAIMQEFINVAGDIDFQKVKLSHGERFLQTCLDSSNAPDTAAKKVRVLKRFFNLAVERGQIDHNPLRFLKAPKRIKRKVRIFKKDQCRRIVKAAKDWTDRSGVRWDILILMALTTGLRKGELLNLIWSDIDFEQQTVTITPKPNAKTTWEWHIKDYDERTLPLIDEVVSLLAEYQSEQQEGCPYVFVPYKRYLAIQKLRQAGQWNLVSSRCNIVGNFSKHFQELVKKAGISKRLTFHDLRKTALSDWLENGMSIFDVMHLAGHSKVTTTQNFYLAVSDDLIDRARATKSETVDQKLLHFCYTGHSRGIKEKGWQT